MVLFLLTCFKATSSENVCTSKVCQKEAELIKKNMDNSVSPCDDFYQFACGNYKPEIPKDKSEVNVFSVLQDLLEEQLNATMSEKIQDKDLHPLKIVKKFFRACMDKGQ